MELYVWDGEPSWGIPSMDLDSLQMMLYVKFSKAPVTIIKSMSPASTPTGQLPVFTCKEGNYTDFDAMTTYLRKENYSCDHDLTGLQCADVLAYQHLLKEKLYPALLYLWWVEPKSYQEVIHSWFYSHMRFPFKMWVPSNKHKVSTSFIEVLVEDPDDTLEVETQLLKHAQECLTMITNRLGEREYFFGKDPTAVDALLVGYLTLLLKVDLKMPVLQNYVKACPNLTRYVHKTLRCFFPNESSGSSSTKQQQQQQQRQQQSNNEPNNSSTNEPSEGADDEFPHKKRNMILCALVAIAANIGYAVATGIVQVDVRDKSRFEGDDDDEYDLEGDQ